MIKHVSCDLPRKKERKLAPCKRGATVGKRHALSSTIASVGKVGSRVVRLGCWLILLIAFRTEAKRMSIIAMIKISSKNPKHRTLGENQREEEENMIETVKETLV